MLPGARSNIAYNAMLERRGYPARAMEGRVERRLKRVRRVMPAKARLAITCALEHFTALLAHLMLEDERLLDEADPTMARLWQWHALEESEHKAVAYDVYESAGGGYLLRSGIMLATTVVFWAKVFEHQVRMMAADGCLWSPRQWWSLARFLFVEPGGMFRLVRLYLAWFRPGPSGRQPL